jgi:hypothetical protein
MWKALSKAFIKPAAMISAAPTLIFTIVLISLGTFHWMTVALTFVGLTGAALLIFSLVAMLRAGSTSCIVKLGPDGGIGQVGRVSAEWQWRDVKCVQEREQSIVIELNAGMELKVPDRVFADAAARVKFLDDVRRWHELANAANTEHA